MTVGSPDPEIPVSSSSSSWSREQDKAFEDALVLYYESQSEDKWEKIAEAVPGKDVAEVKQHYEILIEDIKCIESGLVPLPSYISSEDSTSSRKKGAHSSNSGGPDAAIPATKSGSKADQERRKGVAWTEEEHRLFLLGLDKFGKGDWRSISRNFVISRTPTQVASHAQKYFIRLNSANKDRRRSSIHDITTVNNGETSGAQGPITGQGNNVTGSGLTTTTATTTTKSGKNAVQPVVSSYGTAIGQPVAGPSGASAVGTPVMIPPPYVARPAFPSQVVTATPMNVVPVAYPVSQPTIQQ